MATKLRTTFDISIKTLLESGVTGASGGVDQTMDLSTVWTDGIGTDQADRAYQAQRTLAASGTEDLDLAGVLEDIVGNTLTFAKIKAIAIQVIGGIPGTDLSFGPASSNGFGVGTTFGDATDRLIVKGGAKNTFVLTNAGGAAVTAGTGDKLTFTNLSASNSITYVVKFIGTSA